MIVIYLIVPVIIACIIVLSVTKPRRKYGMSPRGGPRWKNFLAKEIIWSSWQKAGHFIDSQLVNNRVPVPDEQPETNYNDSFVFQGSDQKGNLFMTRIGFRDGGKSAEVWIWMVFDGEKYYNSVTTTECDPSKTALIKTLGLSYTCTDIERGVWEITYNGEMVPVDVMCSLSLQYEPDSVIYHSGVHMDAKTFGRAMAEMPWSAAFFSNLKSESQIRIEQGGRLKGTIDIDGKEHKVSMTGVRDHSWGKRNWSFINRYIWNVLSFNEDLELNGKLYKYLCYTTVNYGTTFKCLVSGWIAGEDSILPIVAATDQKEIGEDGVIPAKIHCRFQPKGCAPLVLNIERTGPEHSWFVGDDGFEVCEAYCTFEVEGIRGVGMSEFGYSKVAGYEKRF